MIIRVKLRVSDHEVLSWALFMVPGDVTLTTIINGIASGITVIYSHYLYIDCATNILE